MRYTIMYKTILSPERKGYFAAPTARLLVTRAGSFLTTPILSIGVLFDMRRRK